MQAENIKTASLGSVSEESILNNATIYTSDFQMKIPGFEKGYAIKIKMPEQGTDSRIFPPTLFPF